MTLITVLTVELTLNSSPDDPFDEAEQMVELRQKIEEVASLKVLKIERTER